MTTALPPASAGPTLCDSTFSGELNGVITQTTPRGERMVKPMRSLTPSPACSGAISPFRRLASSAESSSVWTQRLTSLSPSARVKPASWRISSISGSIRLSTMRAAAERILNRWYGDSVACCWA